MKNRVNTVQLKELTQNLTVLYVEDEILIRDLVSKYLRKLFKNVTIANDGEMGLEFYKNNIYDIVISDISMPKLNGLEMAQEIKNINPTQNILIISAYSDTSKFTKSIQIGVDGYILKPLDYQQLNTTLYKIAFTIRQLNENKKYKEKLEELVEEKTKKFQKLQEEQVNNYKKTLHALVKMIEDRDTYTGGHSLRVAKYSKIIAQNLQLDNQKCENIYEAGVLHDIGKIAIPDSVLLKPTKLNDLEYSLIKEHVNIGVDMLQQIPMFETLSKYIQGHHERLDGSGYPNGLKGDEISLESQIMALCDTFDAMTTSRIYQYRKTTKEALKEIKSLEGKFFKKEVVQSALKVLKDIHIDENISQFPNTQIEKERFSYFYKDQAFNCYNNAYLDLVLIKNNHNKNYKYLYAITLHNLTTTQKTKNQNDENSYLKIIVDTLNTLYKKYDLFRLFDKQFVILSDTLLDIDKEKLEKSIKFESITLEIYCYDIIQKDINSLQALKEKLNHDGLKVHRLERD